MAKPKPTVNRVAYNSAALAEAKKTDKAIFEQAESAVFTLPVELAGKSFSGKLVKNPELVTIDTVFNYGGSNEKEGRIILIQGVIKTDKGTKYQFSMDSEQAEKVKSGEVVTVLAVLGADNKVRLQMEAA